jgi:hypothetical protein
MQKHAKASPRGMKTADMQKWLLQQDGYTVHRAVRKRFPRSPYNVTNIMDLWECDHLDVQNFSKFNDKYKYLLSVIEVFSNISKHRTPKGKDGYSCSLGISFDPRQVFTKKSYVGADG